MNSDVEFATDGQKTATALKDEAREKEERKERRRRRWRGRWRALRYTFRIGIIVIIVGLFAWIFRKRIFITVDSGEVLIVYYRFFGGTNHNQIGHEGLHIIAPWDRAYVYQVRSQALVVPMTVLSKNGLEVHLDAQLRFRALPYTVPYLHRRYGPDYVKTLIIPQLTGSVQEVIGQFLPEELYSSQRGASVDRVFARAKRLIGGVFVDVEDIGLYNVKLPSRVQESIQNKLEEEQKSLAAVFSVEKEKREAERKAIEARGIQSYQDIVKGIPSSVLVWKGIEATLELAKSPNSKVIVIGSRDNLPLMLGNVPDLGAK